MWGSERVGSPSPGDFRQATSGFRRLASGFRRRDGAGRAEAAAMAAAAGTGTGPGTGPGLAAPRTKTKKKQKRFVPQRVKVPRAADPLLAVLAWGVNHQINELSQVPLPVMLLPDDFKASSKIKVNNHLFNRENLPSHFKFKEYCPQVFRNLRERFGIDDQDYQVSLTRSPPHWEGSDRSFLLSYDRTLVVKELSSEDVADVHGLLSHYHQYVVQCHGSTLLPRFLGMYRVSVESEETYLLVMRNMFSHRLPVHRKYDLKGSLVSREASDKEKGKDLPTLKDMDFLNKNEKVYVGEEDQKDFMEKLKRDVEVGESGGGAAPPAPGHLCGCPPPQVTPWLGGPPSHLLVAPTPVPGAAEDHGLQPAAGDPRGGAGGAGGGGGGGGRRRGGR
ncbi:phosphatidylinositol 5-phosphate 4-kinase type-2 gamma isoform X2 [Chroicocephalus ridibundus]|uniref:phosphatidylinositol 5-phosphate 4-kinase type-2 gamma isoform X2 n=1 Tax=Chroicocephalus ridibundus TaxID=1192867 RepID=UPI002FDD6565